MSTMKTIFDFTRNTGPIKTSNGKGYRMFVTIPEDVMASKSISEGATMTIKFYDKTKNELFSGEVTIISKRRISFNKLTEEFIRHYRTGKTMFGYVLIDTNVWIAQEL